MLCVLRCVHKTPFFLLLQKKDCVLSGGVKTCFFHSLLLQIYQIKSLSWEEGWGKRKKILVEDYVIFLVCGAKRNNYARRKNRKLKSGTHNKGTQNRIRHWWRYRLRVIEPRREKEIEKILPSFTTFFFFLPLVVLRPSYLITTMLRKKDGFPFYVRRRI